MAGITDYDYLLRVALVGDSGVGKSALLSRIADNEFKADYISTIGVDFALKLMEQDGKRIKLQLWDTAGQERFHNITMSYYRSVDAIIIAYDVTDFETFEHVKQWYKEIKEYSHDCVQCMLVGNKSDKSGDDRKVSYDAAQDLADDLNMPFFETSAKDATNVDQAFECIVRQTIKCKQNGMTRDSGRPKPVIPDETKQSNKLVCCKFM